MLRPPVGVALLGFVALMAGFAYTLVGLRYLGAVTFGPVSVGSGLVLWGGLTLIVGIMFFAAAFALWATQPWGWLFAHYLALFGLIEAVFVMIANNSLTDGLAVALFPLLVIWYLNDKDVKATFGMESLR
jgi:hypothetical protein